MRKLFFIVLLQLLLPQYGDAEIHFRRSQIDIDADTARTLPGFINVGLTKGLKMESDVTDRYLNLTFQTSMSDESAVKSPCIGTRALTFYNPYGKSKLNIACREAFLMSDENSKTDIRPLSDPLGKILSFKDAASADGGKRRLSARNSTAKENEYQWLSAIAPGAVDIIDSDTVVNYNELIPLLVSSAQELSAIVEQQNEQIARLRNLIAQKKANMSIGKIVTCSPNPTNDMVTVTLRLNNANHDYALYIADSNGIISDRRSLTADDTVISLSLSGKRTGTYHLVLTADGKTADTFTLIKK